MDGEGRSRNVAKLDMPKLAQHLHTEHMKVTYTTCTTGATQQYDSVRAHLGCTVLRWSWMMRKMPFTKTLLCVYREAIVCVIRESVLHGKWVEEAHGTPGKKRLLSLDGAECIYSMAVGQ